MKRTRMALMVGSLAFVLAGCSSEPTAPEIEQALRDSMGEGHTQLKSLAKINDCTKEGNTFNCIVGVEVDIMNMGLVQKSNMTIKLTKNKEGKFVALQ